MTDDDIFHFLLSVAQLANLLLSHNCINVASTRLEDNLRRPLPGFLSMTPSILNPFMRYKTLDSLQSHR